MKELHAKRLDLIRERVDTILAELVNLGMLDNTIIMFTADHGEREEAAAVLERMEQHAELAETPSLRDLVNLLAGARLVVAADTGPAQITGWPEENRMSVSPSSS